MLTPKKDVQRKMLYVKSPAMDGRSCFASPDGWHLIHDPAMDGRSCYRSPGWRAQKRTPRALLVEQGVA
jgi:hypothetical protein